MSSFLVLVLVLVVVVVVAALAALAVFAGKHGKAGGIGFPYRAGKPLFSAAERSFLGVLDQAVDPEHRVFGKVRVADIASVAPGLNNAARQGALNRIAAKHFDFVVCRRGDLSVVCAIELNDASHASQRAQARDALLANVCRVIHLPLLVVPAQATYSLQDVRDRFLAALAGGPAGAGVP